MTNAANQIISSIAAAAPKHVVNAIKSASAKTGVDFGYLLQQAKAESAFKANAKAKTSSATGLYQFIESTWMNMVDKYGDKHGINTAGKSKSDILAMRNDPATASAMAAEFASENERFLKTNWGGDIGATERYFAHFMGAGGAAAFLGARDDNGMAAAADIFPKAAKANKNVFFEKGTGRAKSLDEVYAFFDKKFEDLPHAGAEQKSDAIRVAQAPQIHEHDVKAPTNTVKSHDNNVDISNAAAPTDDSMVYVQPPKAMAVKSYNAIGAFTSLVTNPVDIVLMAQVEQNSFLSRDNDKDRL